MKIFKKFIVCVFSAVLALFMTAPIVGSFASAVTPTDETGLRFSSEQNYEMEKVLSTTPLTVETSFKITAAEAATGQGFIFSNYTNPQKGALLSLRITNAGTPLIYYSHYNSSNTLISNYHNFSTVKVATGELVHLTIKCDPSNGWFYCYVNGVLQNIDENTIGLLGSKFDTTLATNAVTAKLRVGNQTKQATDNTNDQYYFKGKLYSLALFDNLKLTTDVQEDYNYFLDSKTSLVNASDSHLMAGYEFVDVSEGQAAFADVSGNSNHIVDQNKKYNWSKTSKYDPDDYAFSFMVVGDTQIVSRISIIDKAKGIVKEGNTYMDMIYDYIVDSVEEKKVKHVFGLGDITEFNAKNEWEEARRVISKMDGVVPYSIVPGNHDGATNWFANSVLIKDTNIESMFLYDLKDGTVGSPQQALDKGTEIDCATTDQYYSTFFNEANSEYEKQWTYTYSGAPSPDNTVHFFTGNDRLEYMVVALEYGPSDAVLNWASDIIDQHPNHNVIVTTHGYMWGAADDYRYITSTDGGMACTAGPNGLASNNGDDMWAEFVGQHKNIKMLLCGHVDSETIVYRRDTGADGNEVVQMLCDPQGLDIVNVGQPLIQRYGDSAGNRLTGMVATYYVSEDGKTIDVEWYSPIQQAYFSEVGQFTFETEAVEYPRVVASVKNGHGSVTPTKQDITSDSTVVTFIPDKGYKVKAVTVNGTDVTSQVKNNALTITQTTGFHEVEVEYQEITYSLNLVNDDTKGTVVLSQPTSGTYAWGTAVTFTITPKGTNTVKEVKFNGSTVTANSGTYSVSIEPTNNVIEVVYAEASSTYTIGIANETDKGTVNGSLNGAYTAGTKLSFTVAANDGYKVKEVKFNGNTVTATSGTYTVTVAATSNYIQVIYEEVVIPPTYAVEVRNDASKGTIQGTINAAYQAGENISFTVAVIGENTVKEVRFNGRVVAAEEGVYTVEIAATDNLIEVFYNVILPAPTYTLTVENNSSKGTVQGSFESEYEEGEQVSFSVTAFDGYFIKEVRFNGRVVVAEEGVYTVEIASTNNLAEVFYALEESDFYTLTITNASNRGTVVAQGEFKDQYEVGEEVSFSVTSIGSNMLKEVKYNGHVISAVNGVYTVTIMATDNIIEVVYKESSGFGCVANLSSSVTYVVAICGLAIFLKKRKAA